MIAATAVGSNGAATTPASHATDTNATRGAIEAPFYRFRLRLVRAARSRGSSGHIAGSSACPGIRAIGDPHDDVAIGAVHARVLRRIAKRVLCGQLLGDR